MPEVLMPRLSDTMEEGVLSLWLKSEGDEVRAGDILAEIETDKATMELEAYDGGILDRLLVSEGDTVPIGQPIAVIRSPGEAPSEVAAPEAADATAAPAKATAAAADAEPPQAPVRQIRTSPLARRTASEHGIDLATARGSGPGGRNGLPAAAGLLLELVDHRLAPRSDLPDHRLAGGDVPSGDCDLHAKPANEITGRLLRPPGKIAEPAPP